MYNLGLLGSLLSGMCTFLNFIIFRVKYNTLKRSFVNPFGIYGAVYGMMVFSIVFVSAAALQDDDQFALYFLLAWTTLVSVIYVLLYRRRQIYSAEESAILFLAYVMKGRRVFMLC